ncbi:MAG: sigma-70 family RNA polymerase sigma factor [Acidimicrobiales bacterium]|nr:sigma-70 family RNA polymerase sigma factor [Acidimicrobiales bacterium]RZV48670.1 MAG: sigma-70 family RNA polymerase sigma factor [Acidimicrobiales bacterium]
MSRFAALDPSGSPMTSSESRFGEMYQDHFRPVHAYCYRRTSSDRAKDAAAETFLTAWRKIDQAPHGSDALPWLYGIARGVVSNAHRSSFRAKRLGQKLASIGPPREDAPDDVIVMRHETSQILSALGDLSSDDQEVLRLSIWEELPGSDLAIALSISEEAARQRLSRAKKRLADSYNRLEATASNGSITVEGGAQ